MTELVSVPQQKPEQEAPQYVQQGEQDFFDFTQLYPSCNVLIKSDPESKEWISAVVTRVNTDSIDAMGIVGGRRAQLKPFADCWNENDPRIHTLPRVFRSPLRGIFKLGDSELSRISLLKRVKDLEELVQMMATKLATN